MTLCVLSKKILNLKKGINLIKIVKFIKQEICMKQAKFIFVTGGVVSSLGKGINASCIGRLLKSRGLKVFMQKFDPYINVDPSNMSPLQHGEVFVTEDGAEADLDLGHYERFIDEDLNKHATITTGKIYLRVIEKERSGGYGGQTIQVIPHITNAIKNAIYNGASSSGADVVITEVGGTVGDIESLPFLEAIRQVRRELGQKNTIYVHTTLVPYIAAAKELKTKPTQHSVKELRSLGINPDIIMLRSDKSIGVEQKKKIALFCDVEDNCVIEVKDRKNIYEIPVVLKEQKVDEIICNHFDLPCGESDLTDWNFMIDKVNHAKGEVNIALVGKYVSLKDAYLSVYEALKHGGIENGINVKIDPIDSETITRGNVKNILGKYKGIIVPGGFGERAIEGIIIAIEYARCEKKPFLGICLGMQLSIIEFTRNVLGYKEASSRELDNDCLMPVIDINQNQNHPLRIGAHAIYLEEGSLISKIYNNNEISERHRHRYEFSNSYINLYDKSDLKLTGKSDKNIIETIELNNHPFFIAVQFHPEFKSRPNRAHPLFAQFIKIIKNGSEVHNVKI